MSDITNSDHETEPATTRFPQVFNTSQAPPESAQFDFLIGDWRVRGARFAPDGTALVEYEGRWHAQHLCNRRMVFDTFTALLPDGRVMSFFATLRTYSPVSSQWEMTFLTALEPFRLKQFVGRWENDEMRLRVSGTAPNGQLIESQVRFFDISPDSFTWEQKSATGQDGQLLLEARIHATRL